MAYHDQFGSGRLSSPHSFWLQKEPTLLNCQYQYDCFDTLEEELEYNRAMSFAWNIAEQNNLGKPIEDIAVYAYSLATDFYKELNKSTRIWKWTNSEEIYPYKNYVNLLLKQAQFYPEGLQLYRGIPAHNKFNPNIGTVFKTNQLGSASLDLKVGQQFTYGGTLYKIKTNFAIPLMDRSRFPGEKEFLIPFGMDFTVVEVYPRNRNQRYDIVHIEQQPVLIHSNPYNDLVISNSTRPISLTRATNDYDLGQMWYIHWKFLRSARTGHLLEADSSGRNLITCPYNGRDEQHWDYSEEDQCLINKYNGKVVSVVGYPRDTPLQLRNFDNQDDLQKFYFSFE